MFSSSRLVFRTAFMTNFLSFVLILVFFGKIYSQNLIANPGAETCSISSWSSSGNYDTGWGTATLYPHTGSCYFFTRCTSSCTALSQTETLTLEASYLLSFWAFGSGSGSFSVTMGGSVLFSAFTLPTSYAFYSKAFIATSSSMILTFTSTSTARLDDVSLTLISVAPTASPTVNPTTSTPSFSPTTASPSSQPTPLPSKRPTSLPTSIPSSVPSREPTQRPSARPTNRPTSHPSLNPTSLPSSEPSSPPSSSPSENPSTAPSSRPSSFPTAVPSLQPYSRPSSSPSDCPSAPPSVLPSAQPTSGPSMTPSGLPSAVPTVSPSGSPSDCPSSQPSNLPTNLPSSKPSASPSSQPTESPSSLPSILPSSQPSGRPSSLPTASPSVAPSYQPTSEPSAQPSASPSVAPSYQPTSEPSAQPSASPSTIPSSAPSSLPSTQPSNQPSSLPTAQPSSVPSPNPSSCPSSQPSSCPSSSPSSRPSYRPRSFGAWRSFLFAPGHYSISSRSKASLPVRPSLTSSDFSPIASATVRLLLGGSHLTAPRSRNSSSSEITQSSLPILNLTAPAVVLEENALHQANSSEIFLPIGDINDDSLSDSLLCDPLQSSCWIYWGLSAANSSNSTNTIRATAVVSGLQSEEDYFGWSAASLGDINHDGAEDLLVSALNQNLVYVIYGQAVYSQQRVLNLSLSSSPARFFRIVGPAGSESFGLSVACAGDWNRDGVTDYLVSSLTATEAAVYVIYGKGLELRSEDILLLVDSSGCFKITAPLNWFVGMSLDGLGDVNGDGFDDLLLGAVPYQAGYSPQRSFLVLGRANSSSSEGLSLASTREGVLELAGGGFMVSGVGDVNGDGFNDLLIAENPHWQTQRSNAYLLKLPDRLTARPSSEPTATPSTLSHPSSSNPPAPTSSIPETVSPAAASSSAPSATASVTATDRPSFRASTGPSSSSPSAKVLEERSYRPSTFRPKSSLRPSAAPSLSPSSSSSSAPVSIVAQTAAPFTALVVNDSTVARTGRTLYQPRSSSNNDNIRWEIWLTGNLTIAGKKSTGKVIYSLPPVNSNRLIVEDFDPSEDVLDLSENPFVAGLQDLSYRSDPLRLSLPPYQQIVTFLNLRTIDNLTASNFYFSSTSTTSNSNSYSSSGGVWSALDAVWKEVAIVLALFVAGLLLAYCCLSSRRERRRSRSSDEKKERSPLAAARAADEALQRSSASSSSLCDDTHDEEMRTSDFEDFLTLSDEEGGPRTSSTRSAPSPASEASSAWSSFAGTDFSSLHLSEPL